MPGVGDYNCVVDSVHKKIVYNVQIKGRTVHKPSNDQNKGLL